MHAVRSLPALPCSAAEFYALAADVEGYPAFVPGWRSAKIVWRDRNACRTRQSLGLGPLTLEFETSTDFDPPRGLTISSRDPAFRAFELRWQIESIDAATARATISARIVLRSAVMSVAAELALPTMIEDVARAFEQRARSLSNPAAKFAPGPQQREVEPKP